MNEAGPINAFTIDVEDWFHLLELEGSPRMGEWSALESRVERNLDRLLGAVEAAGARSTCFLLGWVADHHPAAAARIAEGGHEVATHGYGHDLVSDLDSLQFRSDLERAGEAIDKAVGVPPVGYRAPGFSITPETLWALDIVAEVGMKFDSSIFPAARAHGGFPGARLLPHRMELPSGKTLMEFPVSVTPILGRPFAYCGGGYLRLFPYSYIRKTIAAANARGESVVVYVHPRDIDPGQPRIPMPASRRFRSYVNLASAYDKLERLLAEFRFGTISEALAGYRRAGP